MSTSPFSKPKFAGAVRMRAFFLGGGPGASSMGEVAIRTLPNRTELWAWDSTMGAELISKGPPGDWREGIYLLAATDLALDSGPEDVEDMSGAVGYVAELYRLAWCEEPAKRVASALATCTDKQLKALHHQGSLYRNRLVTRIDNLLDHLEETSRHGKPFGVSWAEACGGREPVLKALSHAIPDWRREAQRAEQIARKARTRELEPYNAGLEQIMDDWNRLHRPCSANTAMGYGLARASLRDFLVDYSLANRGLPTGKHLIPTKEGLSGSFTVDFDTLADLAAAARLAEG